MIQRIQSLYLVIAWALYVSLFFFDMVTLVTPDSLWYSFNLTGFYSVSGDTREIVSQQWAIMLMAILTNVIFLGTLALFRHRIIQLRFCIYLIIFMLGIVGLCMYKLLATAHAMHADMTYHVSFVFPFISSILVYLAFRAIRKDEILVKAYERLR